MVIYWFWGSWPQAVLTYHHFVNFPTQLGHTNKVTIPNFPAFIFISLAASAEQPTASHICLLKSFTNLPEFKDLAQPPLRS